ncbi:Abi-alpha family protein [Shewanella nanhaiensis]|uniref:DUF4393 domain-containing protein n=1 Tax=Shewanella nanhaiensis TaxID=2864872 RepID=A0ABS7E1F8_9GAMM|nr:Abi-alpha family protein [Shewanella nanhaiensis]MBW8183454.1 DUF4393 domain-containing protein [Shewanella nanhaiensis]
MTSGNSSIDIAGLGEIAKAIPPEVYTQTTETILVTFNKLVAPITETTDGLGRYIKQKFDNMVEVEKAIATYTLGNAVHKAKNKAARLGQKTIPPVHSKSFIKTIEEASKETNPLLHEMWENLLAEQLVNNNFHPHFVEVLSHFSQKEANLLISLKLKNEVTDYDCNRFFTTDYDGFTDWLSNGSGAQANPWDYSCVLLLEFCFIGLLAPNQEIYPDTTPILYRTSSGNAFLQAVSP